MKKISILTPTENREYFLKRLHRAIKRQDFPYPFEWIILDTSEKPSFSFSDDFIRYIHTRDSMTLGEKRNYLGSLARGEFLLHMDDDDYYAPFYLSNVSKILEDFDFFTLSRIFTLSLEDRSLYYWCKDTLCEHHFHIQGYNLERVAKSSLENNFENFIEKSVYGYGFSFAYRKSLLEKISFDPVDFDEDYLFYRKAKEVGAKIMTLSDEKGLALHIHHGKNSSSILPQYELPSFLLDHFFPEYSEVMID